MMGIFDPTRVHRTSVRFGLATADQCVSSLSNFAVGVAIARVAGLAAFGAYSLVYAVWLLVAALHRSLVTDPMAIENDVHSHVAGRHVQEGLAAELCLGLVTGAFFAVAGVIFLVVGQRKFGVCFLGLAPWLPCLLAQDYWRWVGFMKSQPQQSLINDAVFDLIQVAVFVGLLLLGVRSSILAVEAWGIGSLGGAAFGLWQFGARPSIRNGIGRLRLRWGLSKWLVNQNVTNAAASQSTLLLTGAFLGTVGVGGLRAATSLVSGPSLVLIQAGGSVGLPEASKALKERGWPGLRRVQRFVTGAGVVSVGTVALTVFLFGHRLMTWLYGPSFAKFAGLADIVAVSFLLASVALGATLSLKATRNTRRLFHVALVALVASIVACAILDPLFGVKGAAIATLIGSACSTVGLLVTHWRHSKKTAESAEPGQTDEPPIAPVETTADLNGLNDEEPAEPQTAFATVTPPALLVGPNRQVRESDDPLAASDS
jgi:O-antigen/teichoic acid export membrane protein